tara:strand:+ start:3974 stop:7231 length:3258 start_codon:yes stop_codon:yes gene_type:complete
MRNLIFAITAIHCVLLPLSVLHADEDLEFFEKRIRPVLVTKCYECHSSVSSGVKGGLLLDSRMSIRKGGESGPAVVPGKAEESLLYSALTHESFEMPPEEKLSDSIIADFKKWINDGAVDPRDKPPNPSELATQIWEDAFQTRKKLWSFQPLASPLVPTHKGNRWSDLPIDRFILSSLKHEKLRPADRADKYTLARRLSFTLTGLPPSPKLLETYVRDNTDGAWPQLIDALLESPHFGERFARHWMDVVRYTDTYGYEWDIPAKGAWRYRDYLIRAFNSDVPYNQMVREQIAGDLLPSPRFNPDLQIIESHIGPMFYQLGEHRHGDSSEFEGIHQEMLDNKIDAFSKAFQGLTIACARCHDHKIDPISQAEYYALAGTFMSSRWISRTIDMPDRNAEIRTRLQQAKNTLQRAIADVWQTDLENNINVAALDKIQPPQALSVGDINHPWNEIHKFDGEELQAKWLELLNNHKTSDARAKQNNETHFRLIADFSQGPVEGWFTDGQGIEYLTRPGAFTLQQGDQFINALMLPGIATSNLSTKLNGALRSPLASNIDGFFLHALAAGGDFAAHRTVIDNAFLCEKQSFYSNDRYQWKVVNLHKGEPKRRTYAEWATKSSNPNFPPRWGLAREINEEVEKSPHSWFSVSKVYYSQGPTAPQKRLTAFIELLESGSPKSKQEAAALYQKWLSSMVDAWSEGTATNDQIMVLNNLLQTPWITKSASHELLKPLIEKCRELERALHPPRTVNSMADHDPGEDYKLNIRGSYYELGDPVRRGYLRLFNREADETSVFASQQSGRLELANAVASADNPLTARVYVNRVWQWLFGAGIVDTPSNFGKLGSRPSHPELLDWLAAEFIENGWSTKTLIREILRTETWQQSGQADPAAIATDPTNRLLHHFPTRRLEAEAIGDAMLASSGTLNSSLFGAPHNPFRTAEDEMKRLFSGPIDGNRRRMIYTKVTIMEPAKFLATFNTPDPKIPTGLRDITNTPAQALTLLNHPFVVEVASQWGQRILSTDDSEPRSRLERMLTTAYAREISADELGRWEETLFKLSDLRNTDPNDIMNDQQLWADIAHTIFNSKEFIYLR